MNKHKFPKLNFRQSSESGYTILEGLMAILVVSALITMVGPVIAFSAGTRVQARRVELATQAAKTYMNAIRANPYNKNSTINTELVDGITNIVPPDPAKTPEKTVAESDAPVGVDLTCPNTNAYCTAPAGLYCIDFDNLPANQPGCTNDSLSDMIIQPIRLQGAVDPLTNKDDPNKGYKLAIRVYRANSFTPGIGNNLQTTTPSTNVTNALGNRNAPLVTMSSDIPSETDRFSNFKN
jgi:type II secretory pathway pseudopilin PulG